MDECRNIIANGSKGKSFRSFAAHVLQQETTGNQFSVAEIPPLTFSENSVLVGGNEDFGWGTVAIAVGDEIWVGTSLANKIACYKNQTQGIKPTK